MPRTPESDAQWQTMVVAYGSLVNALTEEGVLDLDRLIDNLVLGEVLLRGIGEIRAAELVAWLAEHIGGLRSLSRPNGRP